MRAVVARNLEGRGIHVHAQTTLSEVLHICYNYMVFKFVAYFLWSLNPYLLLVFSFVFMFCWLSFPQPESYAVLPTAIVNVVFILYSVLFVFFKLETFSMVPLYNWPVQMVPSHFLFPSVITFVHVVFYI